MAVVDLCLGARTPLYAYEPGTWGPKEAERLIGADGPDRSGPCRRTECQ